MMHETTIFFNKIDSIDATKFPEVYGVSHEFRRRIDLVAMAPYLLPHLWEVSTHIVVLPLYNGVLTNSQDSFVFGWRESGELNAILSIKVVDKFKIFLGEGKH